MSGLNADLLTAVAESLNALSAGLTDDEDRGWRTRVGTVRRDVAGWTESDLGLVRDASRHLCARNEYAIGGLETRVDYIVGDGFAYAVEPADGYDAGHPAVAQAREYVAAFVELNALEQDHPAECLWRLDRDGEWFARLFPADGIPEVRFVEPECVRSPTGNAGQGGGSVSHGVETAPDDRGRVLRYWIDPDLSQKPEPVPAAEILHVKQNSDSAFPRGVPTYYPVDANLRDCEDLLRAMSATAKARAKIALLIRLAALTNQTEDALRKRLLEGTQADARGARAEVTVEELPFGAIVRTGPNDQWEMPNSNVESADTVGVLQARLRAVGTRLRMPEWMFTGLADQRYSNAFVVEAPTLKAFKRLQWKLVTGLATGRLRGRASLVWRAIRMGVAVGTLTPECLRAVRVTCTPPALEVRDREADSRVNQTYVAMRVKSVRTVQEEQGLDPDQEDERIAAEAPPEPPATPPGGPPPGPGGPTPGAPLPGGAAQ